MPPTAMRICCSPSRRRSHAQIATTEDIVRRVASVFQVPPAVWLSLAFFILVSTTSLLSLFRGGLGLWRTLRSFGEAVDGAAVALAESTARLDLRSAAVSANEARLAAARERLRVTLARHAVLRAAVEDVQVAVTSLLAFYPRK